MADRGTLVKTAMVSGGSRGIGKAIAVELLKSGFEVFICARSVNDLEGTRSEISRFGKVQCFQLDISDNDKVSAFVGDWKNTLNVLVNNAGICRTERLDENENVWEEVLNTNLNGAYYLTKGLVRWIPIGGSIINISSQLGVEGREGFGAYCATKHALLGLTRCWAKELGKKKITVNAVCPGWVKTEMALSDVKKMAGQNSLSEDDMYKSITNDLDLKRFVEPEEVASLVGFLASDKARGITGQNYFIK
ncbi:MAG: SDR family oxidoreductase [Candidatus Scalindua sp.]|jgi:NAD(P)-dependent dehydrogenase (short-subunit alcohol dehydrogenase family)|nr:SDR family oxidoreductase [Candidatus Scalindua sp.]